MASYDSSSTEPARPAGFERKVGLVTGAGKGIGVATAVELARRGATIVAVDSDQAALEAMEPTLRDAHDDCALVRADVRIPEEVAEAVALACDRYGGLDILVNNAGIVRYGDVTQLSVDDWDVVIDTNLKGQFLMARAVVPVMRARGGGAIVNVASVHAFASQELAAAYGASKAGVVALTRTMALDHARDGIRVNCVAPGSVRTPMLESAAALFNPDDPEAAMAAWGHGHPIGRVSAPEDVARVIAFLVSGEAAAVTGAAYVVDGGLLAKIGI